MEIISNKSWEHFVEYGTVSENILYNIALKIRKGYSITDRELSIYVEYTSDIENILKKLL